MNKYLFPMLAVLLFMCGGCSHRSETTPLAGAPGLATFTLLAEDGETRLTGVRHLATGDTVVPPAAYTEVKGDSCVITCTRADKSITAYTIDGRKIGDFELFTPWAGTYCLGVRYVNKTYYFPATGEIITTRNSFHEPELLFLRVGTRWEIRTPKGELKSTLAADSLQIIRDARIPTNLLLATPAHPGSTGGVTLSTVDGQPYKTLTPRQWQALRAKLRNIKVKAETVADIDDFDSL